MRTYRHDHIAVCEATGGCAGRTRRHFHLCAIESHHHLSDTKMSLQKEQVKKMQFETILREFETICCNDYRIDDECIGVITKRQRKATLANSQHHPGAYFICLRPATTLSTFEDPH